MAAPGVAKPVKDPTGQRVRSGLLTALLLLLPLTIVVIFSFGTRAKNGGYEPAFVFDNYARAIQKADPFITSLEMAIAGTIGCLLVGLPLAYFLATRAGK